jgi:hypothetical protein
MIQPVLTITGARPAAHTASPGIVFHVRIAVGDARVHAMVLRCQVVIDARQRHYTNGEKDRLYELFGDGPQFTQTLRAVMWAQCPIVVPAFERETTCDLIVPCTYDLEAASAKYLHAVRDGAVPLTFLCSGSIFRITGNALSIEPIPWDVEARFEMPARVWHDVMAIHFPDSGYIRLGRNTIDRLQTFRGRSACVTWDAAIEELLERAVAGPGV